MSASAIKTTCRSTIATGPRRSPARPLAGPSARGAAPDHLAGWQLTLRYGPRVVKEKHGSLDEAIDSMRGHINAIRAEGTLSSASFIRTYEPAVRVHGRVEVTAPGF